MYTGPDNKLEYYIMKQVLTATENICTTNNQLYGFKSSRIRLNTIVKAHCFNRIDITMILQNC